MKLARSLFSMILSTAMVTGATVTTAHADAIVYEGFGYPPGGEVLAGKNGPDGWGGEWTHSCCEETFTTASGLSYGALAVTPGAATTPVRPPRVNSIYFRPFTTTTTFGADGTTVFFSFLLRPDADFGFYGGINIGSGAGDFFIGKSGVLPGVTPEVPVANYSLEGGGKIAQSGVAAVAGETVLLVMRAQFHDGSADVFDLYVNPDPGGALPAGPDATLTLPDIHLEFAVINNATGWTTDEIRLGATFAEVTPTPLPATPLLIASGFGLLVVTRRRARRQR